MLTAARIESAEPQGAVMRRLLVVLALIASIPDALAGELDVPILRGEDPLTTAPPPVMALPVGPFVSRWAGFYAGVQAGMGVANMDFSRTTQPLVSHELRELLLETEDHPSTWQVLGSADTRSASLGGFIGFNNPWEGMIIGVDYTFSRTGFSLDAPMTPIARVTAPSNGLVYLTQIDGAASMHIIDFSTLRVRAGIDLGNVLPYAGIGVAIGRADLFRTATAFGTETNPATNPPTVTPFSFTESQQKSGALIYGWSLSGGIDILMMPNVFLRAEYEFVNFVPIWDIKASVSTGRLGIAYKF